jgi:hypothetical protein
MTDKGHPLFTQREYDTLVALLQALAHTHNLPVGDQAHNMLMSAILDKNWYLAVMLCVYLEASARPS